MANTADTLGEQETLDGLVTHTLEDFEDGRITTLRQNAFAYNDKLKSVNLPNVTKFVYSNIFYKCVNLEKAYLPNLQQLSKGCFSGCYKLKELVCPNLTTISNNSSEAPFSDCHSLNNVDLSKLQSISYFGLSGLSMGTVVLPSCQSISGSMAFSGNRISTIDLSQKVNFSDQAFRSTLSLVHLVLRSDTFQNINSVDCLSQTPIANGIGWIYVPNDLVDTYKAATNWSAYADQIVSIDEYPKALSGETITDSWDEIFQAEDNDSYKTKYNVGDTKYLVVGGTYILMQIIAFDRDILSSDHTSTAKITWLQKGLSFQFPMNLENITDNGWVDCEGRKFLNDVIYEQIPENIKNKIVAVDKTYEYIKQYSTYQADETATCSDKLWIPSAREIYGGSSYENDGVTYIDFFNSNSVRIKYNGLLNDSVNPWWLRSANSFSSFRFVSYNGNLSYTSSSSLYFLALGFCT